MVRLFEAFAGYGTSSFALKQLGIEHELVGYSEIDKYAIQCFKQNHCDTESYTEEGYRIYEPNNFGNITKIDWNEVPDFDLLTGGFPCQAFSTAGKQMGEADARGVLGLELTRALIAKQPKYFLFENVKGFMSKKFKDTREKFVKSWEDAGYKVVFKVLNTKDFGVPQNRERVWFVGIRKDIEKNFKFPEPFELKLKLKDVLEDNVGEKYFLKQEQVDKLFSHLKNQKDKGNTFGVDALPMNVDDCSRTLSARDYKQPKCIELTCNVSQAMRVFSDEGTACTLRGLGGGMGAKTGLYALGCAIRTYPRQGKGLDGERYKRLEPTKDEVAYALTKVQNDSMIFIEPTCLDLYNNKQRTDCSITLSEPHHNNLRLGIENRVRRLTPKECFRLQGFLNDEVNLDGLSDTQKYKLAGNGQSVNVVKLLLKELF